ncbi:Methionine--tRNA ligase [Bienertia sinuspersici]
MDGDSSSNSDLVYEPKDDDEELVDATKDLRDVGAQGLGVDLDGPEDLSHFANENLDENGSDISDEEYLTVKKGVKGFNKHFCGKEGSVSDYENFDEEIHTPPLTDEDEIIQQRRAKRGDIVSENIDFSTFQWQGRTLVFVVSNKQRGQRVGVTCSGGCSFKPYASWDTRRGSYVVKTIVSEHTCIRTMERNRQLKLTWLAEDFIEVFKARPHWPAKDIIETIRLAYRVLLKKNFSYNVKYYTHRMSHGSMKEHYKKVGRYCEALKKSIPGSYLAVENEPL